MKKQLSKDYRNLNQDRIGPKKLIFALVTTLMASSRDKASSHYYYDLHTVQIHPRMCQGQVINACMFRTT